MTTLATDSTPDLQDMDDSINYLLSSMDDFAAMLSDRFDALDMRLDALDTHLETIGNRLRRMESSQYELTAQLTKLYGGINGLETRAELLSNDVKDMYYMLPVQ